jgi:hypothetical protein
MYPGGVLFFSEFPEKVSNDATLFMNVIESTFFRLFVCMLALLDAGQPITIQAQTRPQVLISTDIGGTDPDDFQSMIHLLMYADRFQIEGLVSSPLGDGRKQNILDMIDLYERDLPKLKKHAAGFPAPDALRRVCKQGSIPAAPYQGFSTAS